MKQCSIALEQTASRRLLDAVEAYSTIINRCLEHQMPTKSLCFSVLDFRISIHAVDLTWSPQRPPL